MGEYWKPVNLTRREFIHPHQVGDGLKLSEWWDCSQSAVRQVMDTRWNKDTDDVRAVSDYGGQLQLWNTGDAPWPEYDDLGELFTEIGLPTQRRWQELRLWLDTWANTPPYGVKIPASVLESKLTDLEERYPE